MAQQVVSLVTAPYRIYNLMMCLSSVTRRLRSASIA
jgi:hypothetical protein